MKFDVKTIIILVLLGISLIFGYKWFFGGDKYSKDKVKELEKSIKALQEERKVTYEQIAKYKFSYDSLVKIEDKIKLDIADLEKKLKEAEQSANLSKEKLDKMRAELAETRRQIDELKKHPANRTGDDLLNSLKNKTK